MDDYIMTPEDLEQIARFKRAFGLSTLNSSTGTWETFVVLDSANMNVVFRGLTCKDVVLSKIEDITLTPMGLEVQCQRICPWMSAS